ncbi:endonuclease [Aliiglaciecola sp. LCG003]|uniref:endonuclease n=1 Tax=Aliiglaciecola sp. LCG003 TaxID=3053655 RepID=UPI0025722F09|nr:endonuclease [Aliiglaciecola sp. LCG003]WJG10523.1 endonuclease [Aliiglaciecola sp. LCG003]
MKRYTSMLLLGMMIVSQMTYANIENGDFENWTGNVPDSWTTIDSGISLAESSNIVHSGSSAAAISVNTATQGSTDFLQSVSVTQGQTYDFSVWVYHTEGNVRARLYVNGYQGYSNESATNQWQQISYSYTASSTTLINVGLRFYDTSGFDGSEVVYIDDFAPTNSSPVTPGCATNSGTLSLTTDNYGSETSWQITNSSASVVASGSGYASNTNYSEEVCLTDDSYTFTINDTYGDGICCSYGSGSYSLAVGGTVVANGASFTSSQASSFTLGSSSGGGSGGGGTDLGTYYQSVAGLTGYNLKTALYNIVNNHTTKSYGDLWTFYTANETDKYYENDNSVIDIYSESPGGGDPYNFTLVSDQCGNYSGEGGCYNREHSFPRSWFGGAVNPMNTDVHHIFPTDGYVNSKRSSYPFGEVSSASFTSQNGSLLGSGTSAQGYTSTVFEPIDEFKGDLARAYFYMATRYENIIAGWENNSTYVDAALDGTSSQVFEAWMLALLKKWHTQDPVSQKELDRNDAAESFQGNRNPFVDHPEFVNEIWGN